MAHDLETLPPELARSRILTAPAAAAFCGYREDWWRALARKGEVPTPIQLGERRVGWRLGDLVDWVDRKASAA
jgi:predicted DNA-binding transcriptional regulator AlpA